VRDAGARTAVNLFLWTCSIVIFLPFLLMLIEATHSSNEILQTPPPLIPGMRAGENYASIIATVPFWRNYLNTVIVAAAISLLSLVFCSLGGYAFAMLDFPLKRIIFAGLLGTVMLPWLVNLVPWFIITTRLKWMNNFLAVIVPAAASAFGVFWMRQYISSTIHPALIDAARIDGCPEGLIFFRIVAPLLVPAYAALGIMNFLASWNNFFYPFLVLTNKYMMTLPLALNLLRGDPYRGMDYGVLMLATTLALAPVMLVFWAASRRFIAGMTAGAVKG
jgi:ABC-type glycerol-3-phosphate transport system permease component